MREKFQRFMIGRNGYDDLARFESTMAWIPLILGFLVKNLPVSFMITNIAFWVIIIHTYYRVFSKNLSKRYQENQKFLNFRYDMVVKGNKAKKKAQQRKIYCFYKCPMCKQEVRVPKGHGKVEITCPKCREKFIRYS